MSAGVGLGAGRAEDERAGVGEGDRAGDRAGGAHE